MDYIEGFFNINKRKTLDDSGADRVFHSYATVIFALFAILALTAVSLVAYYLFISLAFCLF